MKSSKNKWRKYQKYVKNKCKEMSSDGIKTRCKFYRGFGIIEWDDGLLIDGRNEENRFCICNIYKQFGAEKIFSPYSIYIKCTPEFKWDTIEMIINEYYERSDEK